MIMYATVADLRLRLGERFDELYGTNGAKAEADLAAAFAEVNGAVATRYIVPVAAPGAVALLRSWQLTLAEELSWAQTLDQEAHERLTSRVDNVRKSLEKIASGSLKLVDCEENESTIAAMLIAESDPPVFGRDNMMGY